MQNIFFDLGGVLYNLNTRKSLGRFAELGMPIPKHILEETKPFNGAPTGHPIFQLIHKVDIGEVQGPEFLEIISRQCAAGTTHEQVLEAYNGLIEVPESRLELLKKLKQHYRLYLVSNIGDLHWEAACQLAKEKGYDLIELFDQCFCSYQMRVAKPDLAFFEQAVEQSGVAPAKTLYIDDSPINIEAGKVVGLQGYLIEANTLEKHLSSLFPALFE